MVQTEGIPAILVGFSQLIYLSAVGAVGVRLLRLARRTRQLPELLLATNFLGNLFLGYLLLVAGLVASLEPEFPWPWAVAPLLGVGFFVSSVGLSAIFFFTYVVFRRHSLWARALACVLALGVFAGFIGYALAGGLEHGRFEGFWFWLHYGTLTVGVCWVALEPLLYYRDVRRRSTLGLADPIVANRFLLWGGGSLGRLAMVLVGFVPAFLDALPASVLGPVTTAILTAAAILGVFTATSYWLAFFPTRAYARHVLARFEGRSSLGA